MANPLWTDLAVPVAGSDTLSATKTTEQYHSTLINFTESHMAVPRRYRMRFHWGMTFPAPSPVTMRQRLLLAPTASLVGGAPQAGNYVVVADTTAYVILAALLGLSNVQSVFECRMAFSTAGAAGSSAATFLAYGHIYPGSGLADVGLASAATDPANPMTAVDCTQPQSLVIANSFGGIVTGQSQTVMAVSCQYTD